MYILCCISVYMSCAVCMYVCMSCAVCMYVCPVLYVYANFWSTLKDWMQFLLDIVYLIGDPCTREDDPTWKLLVHVDCSWCSVLRSRSRGVTFTFTVPFTLQGHDLGMSRARWALDNQQVKGWDNESDKMLNQPKLSNVNNNWIEFQTIVIR